MRQKIEEAGQDPSILNKVKDVEIDNDGITFPIPMMGKMCMQIEETEEITEELKAQDQMAWVRAMNSIRNRAEEIVRHELIYDAKEVL